MQFFYDGQIRRYLVQTIRVFSNFVVKYGDGSLHQIPVMYGDQDRQVASIVRQNSENVISSAPRIAIYISALDIDRERMGDATYVGKLHFRERDIVDGEYTEGQGKNYTVERLMPTPFKLTMKVDIWSTSAEQKLQILEQILVLFNPSLELQTTDNYIDWTSLSVLNLSSINWDSRTVPVGAESPISVATLTVDTPIWISPPVKVKHLGVITSIITSMNSDISVTTDGYIDGLGVSLSGDTITLSSVVGKGTTVPGGYQLSVYNDRNRIGSAVLLGKNENVLPTHALEVPKRQGTPISWDTLLSQYPGKFHSGSSRLFLTQPNGVDVVGTVALNPLDNSVLTVNWDDDTINSNVDLTEYNGYISVRDTPGNFDAIIDPTKVYPGQGMENVVAGDRFLIIEDIGDVINDDGPDAWKSNNGVDFVAKANDLIEWDGQQWNIIFEAAQESERLVYQTNIYTGVQYMWNGVQWKKSFEGEYKAGQWRIEL
jgi:hypothetical protein